MITIGRIRLSKRVLAYAISLIAITVFLYLLDRAGVPPKDIIRSGLFAMTPLALAATGECINEKAGVVNIGLEGIFLVSCVIGVFGAERLGSGIAGLLVGSLVGAFIGFIFGLMSVYARANQVVAGMGINVFGIGFLPFLLMAIWAFPGIHLVRKEFLVPKILTPIGLLSPVIFVAIAVPIIAHIILNRTFLGIKIKAAGEKPEAADVAGQRVDHIRMFTCTLGGAMAGLGGVFMSLAWFDGIVKEIAAGRGFIALACVVFAGLSPLLALAGAFIFGFAEALAYTVAITPGAKVYPFLPYFLKMVPYIVPLVIVTIFIGRRPFPKALGKPYIRE
ncbi:MAG: ABC transporter permease [Candidatus Hodarchaeaceae archaeon]|nr:ABC transporter permease [Candidatus Hodarchaeaceae archaeon]